MEALLKFSENTAGLILLIGVVFSLGAIAFVFFWMAYKEWRMANRVEKADKADVKRIMEIAKKLRK